MAGEDRLPHQETIYVALEQRGAELGRDRIVTNDE
jgi:hypothetical protein